MKKAILILLTVLLAVSCSQVVYDKLPPEDIEEYSATFETERVNNTTLRLKFTPVPYVETYSYYIGNDEPEPIYNMENYEGGFIVVDIDLTDYPTTGVITLVGSNENGKSAILADHEYSLLTPGELPPDVYVSARYSDSVKFVVNSNDPDAVYVIDIEDSNGNSRQEILKATDGTLVVSELSESLSYTFKITLLDASATTTLSVGTYQYNMVMNLSITDEGFVITGIPDGVADITLKKRDDNAFGISHSVSNSSVTILYSEIRSLESGDFYVIGNNESETYYSNIIQTVTPLVIIEKRENYRSADLYVDLADETLTTDNIYITGVQNVSRSLVYGEEYDVITVSNLSSNHEHSFTIRVSTDDYTVRKDVSNVKTKSFGGKFYEWHGNSPSNFIIYVEDAPDGSDYPYYIYLSENDESVDNSSQYAKSEYRIMPLLDNSIDLVDPDPKSSASNKVDCLTNMLGDENVKIPNESYKMNSLKWNTLKKYTTIKKWYIVEEGTIIEKDMVITESSSDAEALGIPANDTRILTAFYFLEADIDGDGLIEPFIKFKNKAAAEDSLASLGLQTNPNSNEEYKKFEETMDSDAKYCWYLSPVSFSEGETE